MRLARWMDRNGETWVGTVDGGQLVPLARPEVTEPDAAIVRLAMNRADPPAPAGPAASVGAVRLLPPVIKPGFVRDFAVFEAHMAALLAAQGAGPIPDEWYQTPVGFFGNPHRMFGHDELIPTPQAGELDYELECAAIIGREISDVSLDEAARAIAGFVVYNDWSARDIQRHEKRLGGGGATKSKDFAHSIGPWLVTPDELQGGPEGRPQGTMTARVNGTEYSRGQLADMHFSFAQLVQYLARDAVARPGDVVGSGTCASGSILELSTAHGSDRYPWLAVGDVVELEITGLGVLRNVVGPRRANGGGR